MSIQSQIDRLKNAVSAAYMNCSAKKATVPTVQNADNLAACIESILIPSGTKPEAITTNGLHTVMEYEKVNVNVPQGMLNHTRIQKTIGSAHTLEYSIPLSEIGFTPRAWGIVMYPSSAVTSAVSGYNFILGAICDMETLDSTGSSTSGCVAVSSSGNINVSTIGTSLIGAVNGSNFKFSGTYGHFRAATRYRFFFWG